jgi:hypothetical protein
MLILLYELYACVEMGSSKITFFFVRYNITQKV